jgi:hypothetical protein
MILLKIVSENTAASGTSEYISTHFANPVLMVFAQNQMIENSQTSMSYTGVVQPKLSSQSCPNIVGILTR